MSIQLSPVPAPPPPRIPSPDIGEEQEQDQEQDDQGHLIPVLPPTDEGAGAWKYLAGCFLVEAILWGAFNLIPFHGTITGRRICIITN